MAVASLAPEPTEADLPGLAIPVPDIGNRPKVQNPLFDLDLEGVEPPRGRASEDLPAVVTVNPPPAALESDLPAALSPQKNKGSAGNAAPVFAKPQPPAVRDVDLPGMVSSDSKDWTLPDVRTAAQPRSPVGERNPTVPASVVPAFARVATTSNPPALDDFEFELPSPLQAQKGFPELEGGRGAGSRRHATEPGGFDLPNLAAGLPATSAANIGLPSVPGRIDESKKTLTGTGSVPPPAAPAGSDIGEFGNAAMEVDLGLDFDVVSGGSGSAGRGGASDSGSEPPALFGLPTGSLPPAFGAGSAKRSGSEFDVSMGDMELPVAPASFPPKRPTTSSAPPASESVGSSGYGEVSLESSETELAVETEGDAKRGSLTGEVLEFGAVPQAASSSVPGAVAPASDIGLDATGRTNASLSGRDARREKIVGVGSTRTRLVAIVTAVVAIIGGSALTLLPDIGPFGSHVLIDQIRRKDNDALVRRHVEAGQKTLAADDFSGVAKVLADLESAGRDRERLRTLRAYTAYFAYAVEVRHGSQPQSRARAKVILDELGDKYELKYLGLAGAACAAVEGNLAKARRSIATETSRDPRSVDAQAISGEIFMLERRFDDALQTFHLVAKLEPSARAAFGLARAHFSLGQYEAATANAEQAIQRNPGHVGARLLLARIALGKQGDVELAQRRIGEALSLETQQSVADFVLGKTLTGDLHLLRSRISLAEAAFQEALEKDPRSAAALRGLGETLYRAGRYSESLARYEAGLQADPDDVLVAVGAAKAQLALERVREAGALLARLRQANPKNYAVNYWYAKAEEAAGNRDEAEKGYAAAIEVGGTDPIVVDAYVSMALLKNQQGRREEAQKVLATAQEKLPRMPKIHEAVGQLALSEGRYAAAVEQFKLAQTLDSSDLGIKFRLGVALRKNREFESAAKVFDEVTAVDRDYPGLALERGQLYEASGQTEEALRAFESALAKAPTDPDLMLRVACGKVAAGRAQQSEQLLKKVLEQRPNSAETHHCLGRAQLLDGSNLAVALRTLERAVELDPHRAEYHLYVGWAANEAGRVVVAEQALKKALELDQGLGDAYWQRGILRYRQGAVKDAVMDLTRALELRPGRYEAHAALADAYFDLGFEPKALEQWRLATVAQPDNATWRYRYGKLLQAAHRDADAKPELEAALELASKQSVMPRWAWEAHHLLARAIGSHPSAVKHWQAFLELAPRDNVYRDEAKQALAKLGQPWDRD